MEIDKTSTGYRLFKTIFHCRVKAKHLVDTRTPTDELDELTIRRLPTTGDEKYDQELAESFNDVYLPASDIAELIEDGADVMFVNGDDALRAYELIQAHLEWWGFRFQDSAYIEPGKLARVKRDIRVLASTAERLYPMVCSRITKKIESQGLGHDSFAPARPTGGYGLNEMAGVEEVADYLPVHRDHDELFNPGVLSRLRPWEKS